MSHRYFSDTPIAGDAAVLAGQEAQHLSRVMRASVGQQVTIFDGTGWEFDAVVQRVGRHEVELAIASRQQIDRELPLAIRLGVALPKGDRQAWLVEKAVELGVAALVPLRSQRSVAQPVNGALSRLRRAVVEASKQCGRNRLMQIDPPQSWESFVNQSAGPGSLRWLAHPGGMPLPQFVAALSASPTKVETVQLAIGPEGGLSDAEIATAVEAGWQLADLGPRILRVETAAVFLSAVAAFVSQLPCPEREPRQA